MEGKNLRSWLGYLRPWGCGTWPYSTGFGPMGLEIVSVGVLDVSWQHDDSNFQVETTSFHRLGPSPAVTEMSHFLYSGPHRRARNLIVESHEGFRDLLDHYLNGARKYKVRARRETYLEDVQRFVSARCDCRVWR